MSTLVATRSRVSSAVFQFRIVYALLVANFALPAISYVIAPEMALDTVKKINAALGGAPYAAVEGGHLWHMLAVTNVFTLGFLCALLLWDLRRFHPALPGLLFLKGSSAVYALGIGIANHLPVFGAVFLLDGTTTFAMWWFARRALRELSS